MAIYGIIAFAFWFYLPSADSLLEAALVCYGIVLPLPTAESLGPVQNFLSGFKTLV